MSTEWTPRPEFNWCYNCWFNAKIESKQTEIGVRFLCLNCGFHPFMDYKLEAPKHFTDEEWQKFWEENIKAHV
jgi:hypothetical protein